MIGDWTTGIFHHNGHEGHKGKTAFAFRVCSSVSLVSLVVMQT
jgi:hypothetical protein